MRYKPNPSDGKHTAFLAKAFAAHSGQAPADVGADRPEAPGHPDAQINEQRESELLQSLGQNIDAAKSAVEELTQIQSQEQPEAEPEMENPAGSPSVQGAA